MANTIGWGQAAVNNTIDSTREKVDSTLYTSDKTIY